MGQIFMWEDVENRHIPNKKDFQVVEEALRHELYGDERILCALLFGSVVRGDSNIRSDIDCLVIYETGSERTVSSTLQSLAWFGKMRHVPINFVPGDRVLCETRLHHLGPSLVTHMQASIAAGGLIWGTFEGLLRPTVTVTEEIEWYIRSKTYNLQEAYAAYPAFSTERKMSLLKKAYEAPMHVARKMLQYQGKLQGDSKKDVVDGYCASMPKDLVDGFKMLRGFDEKYTEILLHQLEMSQFRDEYEAAIEVLEDGLPDVLDFLRQNILHLQSLAC